MEIVLIQLMTATIFLFSSVTKYLTIKEKRKLVRELKPKQQSGKTKQPEQ